VAVVICTKPNNCGKSDGNNANNAARRALRMLDFSDEWAQHNMARAFGDHGFIGA